MTLLDKLRSWDKKAMKDMINTLLDFIDSEDKLQDVTSYTMDELEMPEEDAEAFVLEGIQ